MKKRNLRNLVLSGLFVAIGIVLPFLTGQVPEIGSRLLPMHLPVLICGFVCGGLYGAAVGAITPILRSLVFTMPAMFPSAFAMAFELAAYGLMTGFLHKLLPKKTWNVYLSLIISMLIGRCVWGGVMGVITFAKGSLMTLNAFFVSEFANGLPGIILQIVIVPVIVMALQKAGYIDGSYGSVEKEDVKEKTES